MAETALTLMPPKDAAAFQPTKAALVAAITAFTSAGLPVAPAGETGPTGATADMPKAVRVLGPTTPSGTSPRDL